MFVAVGLPPWLAVGEATVPGGRRQRVSPWFWLDGEARLVTCTRSTDAREVVLVGCGKDFAGNPVTSRTVQPRAVPRPTIHRWYEVVGGDERSRLVEVRESAQAASAPSGVVAPPTGRPGLQRVALELPADEESDRLLEAREDEPCTTPAGRFVTSTPRARARSGGRWVVVALLCAATIGASTSGAREPESSGGFGHVCSAIHIASDPLTVLTPVSVVRSGSLVTTASGASLASSRFVAAAISSDCAAVLLRADDDVLGAIGLDGVRPAIQNTHAWPFLQCVDVACLEGPGPLTSNVHDYAVALGYAGGARVVPLAGKAPLLRHTACTPSCIRLLAGGVVVVGSAEGLTWISAEGRRTRAFPDVSFLFLDDLGDVRGGAARGGALHLLPGDTGGLLTRAIDTEIVAVSDSRAGRLLMACGDGSLRLIAWTEGRELDRVVVDRALLGDVLAVQLDAAAPRATVMTSSGVLLVLELR